MTFYIRKASGEQEPFDIKKFRFSLRKVGADSHLINQIVDKILKEKPKSTKEIHEIAIAMLSEKEPSIAGRYNLKRALMELGPAGYPFEKFIGEVFLHQNYHVKVNQFVAGICVDHEVDVIAQKDEQHFMIECKYHNRPGKKSDVKVALYIQARFEDVQQAWQEDIKDSHEFHQPWIVTNTRFTTEAIKYATCRNMRLLGWDYPEDSGLAKIIDMFGLHPITSLISLNRQQKRIFIKNGWVLCRDARKYKNLLQNIGFSPHEIEKLIQESEALCELR